MDSNSLDETSKSSKVDIDASRSSIKSTKSLDKNTNSPSKASLKSEKDVHFAKASIKSKPDNQKLHPDPTLKVPSKIIANWRLACDRTRDRTRDLLKKWKTLPDDTADPDENKKRLVAMGKTEPESCGWSVHVWTTWVDRFSTDTDTRDESQSYQLTATQSNKFLHFFTFLLDHDQDNLISEQDFEMLIERLRHFADWSTNSAEFNILREIERGFMETFLQNIVDERLGFELNNQSYITSEGWLRKWAELIKGAKTLSDFPLWLQYFVKVLFQVINRSGSGIITRDELSSFYSSVLGLDTVMVGEIIDLAYQAMTSNGDHLLEFRVYRLCFANYLLGRFPNGPGQFLLGAVSQPSQTALFPVDYSALNAQPEDLEQYNPNQKTNRHSIIV